MGAAPTALLVALCAPIDMDVAWAEQLAGGLAAEAGLVGAAVVGGDMSASPTLTIAVTALGDMGGHEPVVRSGAQPGDVVALAGRTGYAAAGYAVLSRGFRTPKTFVEAHRRHLADEAKHVQWDEELLDALWRRAHPLLRGLNAKLFAWMLEEFFGAPKRAQLRVLDELVRELPELRGRLPEMRSQVLALSRDEAYRKTLYSREIVPRTFARFDDCPEFRALSLCGYQPNAVR